MFIIDVHWLFCSAVDLQYEHARHYRHFIVVTNDKQVQKAAQRQQVQLTKHFSQTRNLCVASCLLLHACHSLKCY